jgi:hypothetical protein
MNTLSKTIVYFKMSLKTFASKPSIATLKDIVRFYPAWLQYLSQERNSVQDKTPWLTFGAIQFIKKIARRDMTVFEYGSGGSTLFWAERVDRVFSIEHNREWHKRMVEEFQKLHITNVEFKLVEAEIDQQFNEKSISNPDHYISEDSLYVGKNFESYVKQIERFPDRCFDIIVIDGRARPSCILHSQKKLKENGFLIIDNSERDYYMKSFNFNKPDWDVRNFYGPVPYIRHFSQTTIIKKNSKIPLN